MVSCGSDVGLGLRVIADFKTSYAYSNAVSETEILSLAVDLAEAAKAGAPGVAANEYSLAPPADLSVSIAPNQVETAKKTALVREANVAARSVDGRIRQVKVVYSDKDQGLAIANSEGLLVEEHRTHSLLLTACSLCR